MAKGRGMEIMIGLGRPKGMAEHGASDYADEKMSAEYDALSAVADALHVKDADIPALHEALRSFLEACYPELGHGSEEDSAPEEG